MPLNKLKFTSILSDLLEVTVSRKFIAESLGNAYAMRELNSQSHESQLGDYAEVIQMLKMSLRFLLKYQKFTKQIFKFIERARGLCGTLFTTRSKRKVRNGSGIVYNTLTLSPNTIHKPYLYVSLQ